MKKEQLTIAKIADKIKKYEKTGQICVTNFLDPSEIVDAEIVVRKIPYCFWGGYNDAERKILIIGYENDNVENMEENKKETVFEEVIQVLTIEGNKALSHRDVLGSLIGLGLSRDVIGDILIKENRADVFVIKDISKYIMQNLERIGREKVSIYINSFNNLIEVEDLSKEIKTTVASLRIDAIISGATGLSRELSSKMIQNQKVKLNHKLIENTSKQLKIGDKISVRGYGRIELVDVLGETKKDRIRIILKRSN